MRWYKSMLWTPYEDGSLVFKSRETQEVFTFSKKGIWNETGIDNPLLN
jgi:hypothetical protein